MAAAKRGAAAMKLLYEKLRSPPSSMAAAKRGAAAMKLSYEKLRSALPLPCSSPMGLMVSFKLTKLIYGQRGIEELLKKRMEENQKKTEAGSGDEKNEGVMKPTMSPVEMMSTFLVLQGIVDSVLKDVSTVHAVRKETVENAASILWKTATGADVREQKADVSSILKELRNGNANVEAIAVKIDAVNVKLDTLLGNFNIPIPPTPTPSIAVAVPPPTSSTASPPPPTSSTAPSQPPPPPPTNGDGNGGGTSSTAPPQPPPPPPTNGGGNGGD